MWPSSSGPRYVPGGSATAAVALLVAVMAVVIRTVHVKMNKGLQHRENVEDDEALEAPRGFRYIL